MGSAMTKQILPAVLVLLILVSPFGSTKAWPQSKGLSPVGQYTGRLVWVVDRTGGQVLARVVSATDSDLAVTLGGVPQTIPAANIRRILIDGDSVRNGAIIGGLVGIPAGIFSCQGAPGPDCDFIAHAIAGAAIYGALGAFIDLRIHGRTVIYRAPGS